MPTNDQMQGFISELRRGGLTLAALGCLLTPRYGYALLQVMQERGIEIEANTLYPLLRRLEGQGLLTSSWDTSESRPRKYYTVSERGREIFDDLAGEWRKIRDSIDAICAWREQDE